MMNEKVTQMVDLLFRDVLFSGEVQALYDEVLNNCQDRFADLQIRSEKIAFGCLSRKEHDRIPILAPYYIR